MPIRIQLFAAFADFIGTRELSWEYHAGLTCKSLWQEVEEKFPRVRRIPAHFAIGDEYVQPETALQDGDSILVFPPVSGGSSSFIYETPLSVERALKEIQQENAGGEAIFIGRVRRWSEGKKIQHLFYECHPTMAESEIAKIMNEMHSRWPIRVAHFQHRIGKLEVGDIAVIVAVSSEHRKEALEACRYGIDELKHRVPIWKKEISEEGEEWVGACQ
jgi:molybdopterin synthase catalytic subunit/molybdopterin converting factor small subunit